MADFPGYGKPPPFLHTWSRFSGLWEQAACLTSFPAASMSWGGANVAVYVPMSIPFAYKVERVFWVNGSTVSLNADFGIYTADGVQLYATGSTAKAGSGSQPQYVTPGTPLWLYPGDYYFAHSVSNTTANRSFGNVSATAALQRMAGIKQEASALPLPAVATFATPSVAGVPLCGVTWTTSGF